MIETSTDWAKTSLELKRLVLHHLRPPFHADAFKLINNIGQMVVHLSKLEVTQRNTRARAVDQKVSLLVKEINKEISLIEQHIVLSMLYE